MSAVSSRRIIVRFASDDDDQPQLVETREFGRPCVAVAAEQFGTEPWVVWVRTPQGRDFEPREAREFAAALVEAAAFAEQQNLNGAPR